MRGFGGLLVVGIVVVIAYFVFMASLEDSARPTLGHEIGWEFLDVGLDESTLIPDIPETRVRIKIGTSIHLVGTYSGNCFIVEDSSWGLLSNEVTGVICIARGVGKEIGVFNDSGKLFLKVGEVAEGTRDGAGFRGNFATLFEVK